jgi:hypothetical protein
MQAEEDNLLLNGGREGGARRGIAGELSNYLKADVEYERAVGLDESIVDTTLEHYKNMARVRPKPEDLVKMVFLLMKREGKLSDALNWALEADRLSLRMTDMSCRAHRASLETSCKLASPLLLPSSYPYPSISYPYP